MRASRLHVLLLLALLASACQHRVPKPIGALGPCPALNEGPHRLVRRLAAQPTLEFRDSGGVVVRVSSALYQEMIPLPDVRIRLARTTELAAQGRSDSAGTWTSSAVPAGRYVIDARLIGYQSLGDSLTVRGGFRDTVDFQLRRDVLC